MMAALMSTAAIGNDRFTSGPAVYCAQITDIPDARRMVKS
jgi:hypothetical protein